MYNMSEYTGYIPNYVRWLEYSTQKIHAWKLIDNIKWIDITNPNVTLIVQHNGHLNNIYGTFLKYDDSNKHIFIPSTGQINKNIMMLNNNKYDIIGKILFYEYCVRKEKQNKCSIM